MKHLVLPMLAVLGSTMISFFVATSALAQDTPHSEEYMKQHDGGDRAEYLQEMEHSDRWLYVPSGNDASFSTINHDVPAS